MINNFTVRAYNHTYKRFIVFVKAALICFVSVYVDIRRINFKDRMAVIPTEDAHPFVLNNFEHLIGVLWIHLYRLIFCRRSSSPWAVQRWRPLQTCMICLHVQRSSLKASQLSHLRTNEHAHSSLLEPARI